METRLSRDELWPEICWPKLQLVFQPKVGHRFKKGNKRMLTSFERNCGVSDGQDQKVVIMMFHFEYVGGSRLQNEI